MDNKKKPEHSFKKENLHGFEIFHNLGPELGKAGEQLVNDIAKAAAYAFATVQEKYPDLKEEVKTKVSTGCHKAKETTNNLKEAMKPHTESFLDFLDAMIDLITEEDDDEECTCTCGDKDCKCGGQCTCGTCTDKECNCKCHKKKDVIVSKDDDCDFITACRQRADADAAEDSFVKTICARARAFAKGENPINVQLTTDDSMRLKLVIYPNELHPTLTPLFDGSDIFGARVILCRIAEELNFPADKINYQFTPGDKEGYITITL